MRHSACAGGAIQRFVSKMLLQVALAHDAFAEASEVTSRGIIFELNILFNEFYRPELFYVMCFMIVMLGVLFMVCHLFCRGG